MNRNDLFRSLGEVDDAVIERSETAGKKRAPALLKWGAAAACLIIVLAAGYGILKNGLSGISDGGNGGGEGLTYMSYSGPVFPLSAAEACPDIEAQRNVDFDFSPYISWTETREYTDNGITRINTFERYSSKSTVTDSYTLKNNSREDRTLTLIYPFAAGLYGGLDEKPTMTVDGEKADTEMHIGPYTGSFTGAYGAQEDGQTLNLAQIDSWEGYVALFKAGYMSSAFDELPELTQPAVVYEISDRYGNRSEKPGGTSPNLNMEFYIDYDRTTVLSYGFNSGSADYETGFCARGTHVPHPESPDYGESAYLIVLGEDIGNYSLKAYANGAMEKEIEDAGATVSRYETTLGVIFEELAGQYLDSGDIVKYGEDANFLSALSTEEFAALASEFLYEYGLLSDEPKDRYADGMLEEIFSETAGVRRVIYLTLEATVPAGGSLTLTAEMAKPASMDYIGAKEVPHRNGYDMATQLGSVLTFTKQTASVSNTEAVEILRQNFGFDLENGVTSVELDPAEPHYFIDVCKKESSQ